jgi:alpha-tubulin suppressor-like RCC1 family protein
MRAIPFVAVLALGACFSKPPFSGGGPDTDPTAPPRIAAGNRHACQIDPNGELLCWGDNSYGQLGERPVVATGDPALVVPDTGWFTVVAGGDHTCGARDGLAYCWGRNDSLQSSPDDQTGSDHVSIGAVAVPGDIERIAAGDGLTCAINTAHEAYCWGSLNFGHDLPRSVTQLMPGTQFRQIAIASDHACAVREDGRAVCWGDNHDDQLGQDSGSVLSLMFEAPQPITSTRSFVSLSAAFEVTCGVTSDQQLVCWGTGADGQIGVNDALSHLDLPVGTTQRWSRVAFGGAHTCAIGDGSVYCFGDSVDGAIGAGQFAGRTTLGMPVLDNAVDIASGYGFSCAQQSDGVTQCWGANVKGELGNHEIAEKLAPVKAELPGPASQIVAGDHHACALVGTAAYCWGLNSDRQLNGSSPMLLHAKPISAPGSFTQLAAGDVHTCGLQTDASKITCWGSNGSGQLGTAGNVSTNVITAPTPQTWSYVAAGAGSTCAIATTATSAGALWCWGDIPGYMPSAAPVLVDDGTSWVWRSIALGDGFGIGVISSGGAMRLRAFAAGEAQRCAAGLVSADPLYPPQEIFAGLQPMVELPILSASHGGSNHACARFKHDTEAPFIACWGDNGGLQTGSGTTPACGAYAQPATLLLGVGATPGTVAVDGHHSCAIDNADKVSCWGDDDDLQARSSAAPDSSVPAVVFGATHAWVQIASGQNVMCGIRSGTMEVDCWGRNKYGEVGDGTQYRPTPVIAGVP